MKKAKLDYPLTLLTPDAWAEGALSEPLALLNDHAHLEKKAASNALDLLPRWPEVNPPKRWVQIMTSVARDEISHLATVTRLLESRGGKMSRKHVNTYASRLRDFIRLGRANEELLDRLLVSAMIELRSCERFEVLSKHATDPILAKLYKSLWASEHGHFSVFLELAKGIRKVDDVAGRWDTMLAFEAKVIRSEEPGPRMHSWI